MLTTRITERFGLRYPVMSAPMSGHSGGRLAAAVSRAGGLGLFGGTTPDGQGWLRDQVREVRAATDAPFGVGFISHLNPIFPELFDAALEEDVPVIALSFADPEPWLGRAREAGAATICQVQTLDQARRAVDVGADVIVAQGNEAGGHTGTWNLLPFLARVLELAGDVPVLAAGGIGDGRTLAAVLAAGAEGAWVGTAFLATPEAVEVTDAYRQRIVDSDGEDSVFTRVFDILDPAAFGIPPWPEGIAARALRNRLVGRWHGREAELDARLDEVVTEYRQGLQEGDLEVGAVYAGQSATFVESVRPASEVLAGICDAAEDRLRRRWADLLG